MKFTFKKPSKKLIIGSLLMSVFLHLFICKIPVDAFQKKESIVEVAVPQNFVPIQIISVAAPRVEAAATPQVPQQELVKEVKKETEIKAPVESETAKFKFSKKEEKLEEVTTLPKPKSQIAKEQPQQIQQPIQEPVQQADYQPSPVAGHNTYNSDARLTSNDNGNAESTIIRAEVSDFVQRVAVKYPARSVQLGQEGVVLVRALVDASGSIKDVTIHSSSGYNLLDESARTAVKQWHFQPSFFAGRASTSWVEVPVKFRLQTARL